MVIYRNSKIYEKINHIIIISGFKAKRNYIFFLSCYEQNKVNPFFYLNLWTFILNFHSYLFYQNTFYFFLKNVYPVNFNLFFCQSYSFTWWFCLSAFSLKKNPVLTYMIILRFKWLYYNATCWLTKRHKCFCKNILFRFNKFKI